MKLAAVGSMTGVGQPKALAGPATGLPTGLAKGPGPIKPKTDAKPAQSSAVAPSVFGTVDGLSAGSGGAGASTQLGGVRPAWMNDVMSSLNVKKADGPLALPGDGKGPLDLSSGSTPKLAPKVPALGGSGGAFEVKPPNPTLAGMVGGFAPPPAQTATQPPAARPNILTPPPQAAPPKLITKNDNPFNPTFNVAGQPHAITPPELAAGRFEPTPQSLTPEQKAQFDEHARTSPSVLQPERASQVPVPPERQNPIKRMIGYPETERQVTPEKWVKPPVSLADLYRKQLAEASPEAAATQTARDQVPKLTHGIQSDNLSLSLLTPPGMARATGAGVAGRLFGKPVPGMARTTEGGLAGQLVNEVAPGMAAKAAPGMAVSATGNAGAAPAAAGWMGRQLGKVTAPRAVAPGTSAAVGRAVDPTTYPSQALGWLGRRESLPAGVTGAANALSRAVQPVEAVAGSLLGTRVFGQGLQGNAGAASRSLITGGVMNQLSGNKADTLPFERLVGVPGQMLSGNLSGAAGLATRPLTSAAENIGQPLNQAIGNVISTGDMSRMIDPLKAIGQNMVTSTELTNKAVEVRNEAKTRGVNLTPDQAMAEARKQMPDAGWKPVANQPMTGPTATDYASNLLTGKPLKPVQVGDPAAQPVAQPPVDPVKEFATKTAPDTVNKFNTAMAAGDLETANKMTQEHLQAAGGDPSRVIVSMLGRLGPDNFGMPEPEFKKMIDGWDQPRDGSTYDKYMAAREQLTRTEADPAATDLEKKMARQAYGETSRLVQGRAVEHYDRTVMPQVKQVATTAASKLTEYRDRVNAGGTLSPEEVQDLQAQAEKGRQAIAHTASQAMRKAQLDFGIADTPTPQAGDKDVATIADVYKQLNATKPVLKADGTPLTAMKVDPQTGVPTEVPVTEPAHPLGQQVQANIARDLAAAGADPSKASDLFSSLDGLPKLLLYGGLALSAVGGLGSAFGLFDGGPIMALLGIGAALTGLAGGDPSKLITKDFWTGLPGKVTGMFSGGGAGGGPPQPGAGFSSQLTGQLSLDSLKRFGLTDRLTDPNSSPQQLVKMIAAVRPDQREQLKAMLPPERRALVDQVTKYDQEQRQVASQPAPAPSRAGNLAEFFKEQKIPVDQTGMPTTIPTDPAAQRRMVGSMTPSLKQEAVQKLDELVAQKVKARMGFLAPTDPQGIWDKAKNYGGPEGQAAFRLRELLMKQGAVEFAPDFTPSHLQELGVYGRMHAGTGPRLASVDSNPDWLKWYQKYSPGQPGEDDDRQIRRWKSFRAGSGAMFANGPTPRRAFALMNWGIDPVKLVPESDRAWLRANMDAYRKQQTDQWLKG